MITYPSFGKSDPLFMAWHILMLGACRTPDSVKELEDQYDHALKYGIPDDALYWDFSLNRFVLCDELSPERVDTFAFAILHDVYFRDKINVHQLFPTESLARHE
jgi:hypothetical protein